MLPNMYLLFILETILHKAILQTIQIPVICLFLCGIQVIFLDGPDQY